MLWRCVAAAAAVVAVSTRPSDDSMTSTVTDILTCGRCRHQFPLNDFISFLWHKVLGCNGELAADKENFDKDEENDRVVDDDVASDDHSPTTPSSAGEPADFSPATDIGNCSHDNISRATNDRRSNHNEDGVSSLRRKAALSNSSSFTGNVSAGKKLGAYSSSR